MTQAPRLKLQGCKDLPVSSQAVSSRGSWKSHRRQRSSSFSTLPCFRLEDRLQRAITP